MSFLIIYGTYILGKDLKRYQDLNPKFLSFVLRILRILLYLADCVQLWCRGLNTHNWLVQIQP